MRVWVDASTLIALESTGEGPRPPGPLGADRDHASDRRRALHGARIPTPAGGPGVVDRGRPRPGRPEAVDVPRLGDWRGILVRDAEGRPPSSSTRSRHGPLPRQKVESTPASSASYWPGSRPARSPPPARGRSWRTWPGVRSG